MRADRLPTSAPSNAAALASCVPVATAPAISRTAVVALSRTGALLVACLPALLLGTACTTGTDAPPAADLPPVVTRFTASALSLSVGESTALSAQASDPEGKTIQFQWDAPAGVFSSPQSASTTWTAQSAGSFLISCTVTDETAHAATLSVVLTVSEPSDDPDGDGYTESGGDCRPFDDSIHPGAPEVLDGQDNNCNGQVDEGSGLDDQDHDGFAPFDGDCDDTDPAIHPGVDDPVDQIDNDCDGLVDEGSSTADDDRDGVTEAEGDCNDARSDVYPGALELADGADNNCDGVIDEGTGLFDDDLDGFSEATGDCDDSRPEISPVVPEVADGLDQNCNGLVDEGTPAQDLDGDGYSLQKGDCDDADPSVHPLAPELSDGLDNDCDGEIDERTDLSDDDLDGFTEADGDCDDTRASVYPGAPEYPDGVDQDCDGLIDEGSSGSDDDLDGFSEDEGDCDDFNLRRSPARPEVPDGLDNDCDALVDEGTVLYDGDGDGYSLAGGDCDDTDPLTWPGAVDRPDDAISNDCVGEPVAQAPVAVAAVVGATGGCLDFKLSAAGSYDPEGNTLQYQWYVLSQPEDARQSPAELTGADSSGPQLRWGVDGVYTVGLAVSDGALIGAEALLTLDTLQLKASLCERDDDHDGHTPGDGDCNDQDPGVYPGAVEVCDGVDQDCDGKEILFDEHFDDFDPASWVLYGNAIVQEVTAGDGEILLTDALRNQTGQAYYFEPVPLDNFSVYFEFLMEGGSSGNGLTMVLLDPATASFQGGGGGGNGVLGLPGVGLEFDTNRDSEYDVDTSSDHIAVVRTSDLKALATYPRTNHRENPMTAELVGEAGTLSIYWNGVKILTSTPGDLLPPLGWLGFAAATGSETDRHHLTRVRFECR